MIIYAFLHSQFLFILAVPSTVLTYLLVAVQFLLTLMYIHSLTPHGLFYPLVYDCVTFNPIPLVSYLSVCYVSFQNDVLLGYVQNPFSTGTFALEGPNHKNRRLDLSILGTAFSRPEVDSQLTFAFQFSFRSSKHVGRMIYMTHSSYYDSYSVGLGDG